MSSEETPAAKPRSWVITIILLGVFGLVAYEVYSGVVLKKVTLPGTTIEFGDKPAASGPPRATRNFFLGRWEVDQSVGQASGTSRMDYFDDGTFSGYRTGFLNGAGTKESISGRWQFTSLSEAKFRLSLDFASGENWQGTFQVFDQDHIQNIDTNYVALRLH